jgi:predicted dehydrogenase
MTEPLGWGLIGTGGIAETFAADLMFTESSRVAAVGSRQMESADRFADRFNIPNRHASYEALVAIPTSMSCMWRLRTRCTSAVRYSRCVPASRCS